jgi:hypothetical protein
MGSLEAEGGLDAAAAGIGLGLRRAATTGLPRQDVEQTARAVVFNAVERRLALGPGPNQPNPPQIALFAEFVTLALAAGVTTEHVENWIGDLCGDWG